MSKQDGSSQKHPLRKLVELFLAAAIAVFLVEGPKELRPLQWADALVQDYYHSILGRRADLDTPVVLISIDDETLEKIPDPMVFWGPHVGTALTNLAEAGVTVVGVDLLLQASGVEWMLDQGFDDPLIRGWDRALFAELAQQRSVLATMIPPGDSTRVCTDPLLGSRHLLLPNLDKTMGYVNLAEDDDGVFRRFRPVFSLSDKSSMTCPRLGFSMVLALRHLGLDPSKAPWNLPGMTLTRQDTRIPTVFVGPRDTFPRVSFWKLVEPEHLTPADRELLKGRVAIVGTDHTGHHDIWMTPYDRSLSGDRFKMPGYEVQANNVATLINGVNLTSPDRDERVGLLFLYALLMALIFYARTLQTSLLIGLISLPIWLVLGYYSFKVFYLLLPVVSIIATVLLIFAMVYALRFAGEARERRFLRYVFSRYLSDEVVSEVLANPRGLGLGGAKRELTVLFSDIRNFTTLSEQLTPEEVVELLNAYFSRACPPIVQNRGRIDKFIGDAIMAVFGAPVAHENHARSALQAAIGMAEAAVEFQTWVERRFPGLDLPKFDIGVGVHSGDAVAGNIGFERAIEYAVIGDTVNTASRLEGMTKVVGVRILASRKTVEAAGMGVETGVEELLQVKGRTEPVEALEIVSIAPSTELE